MITDQVSTRPAGTVDVAQSIERLEDLLERITERTAAFSGVESLEGCIVRVLWDGAAQYVDVWCGGRVVRWVPERQTDDVVIFRSTVL